MSRVRRKRATGLEFFKGVVLVGRAGSQCLTQLQICPVLFRILDFFFTAFHKG